MPGAGLASLTTSSTALGVPPARVRHRVRVSIADSDGGGRHLLFRLIKTIRTGMNACRSLRGITTMSCLISPFSAGKGNSREQMTSVPYRPIHRWKTLVTAELMVILHLSITYYKGNHLL